MSHYIRRDANADCKHCTLRDANDCKVRVGIPSHIISRYSNERTSVGSPSQAIWRNANEQAWVGIPSYMIYDDIINAK